MVKDKILGLWLQLAFVLGKSRMSNECPHKNNIKCVLHI